MNTIDKKLLDSFNFTLSLISLKCDAYDMAKCDDYNSIGEQLLSETKKVVSSVTSTIDSHYIDSIIKKIDNMSKINPIYIKASKDILMRLVH